MTPVIPAVAPNDDVAVVVQVATMFTLVGTAIAARASRRQPDADPWLLTARWTLLGAVAGAVFVVVKRIP